MARRLLLIGCLLAACRCAASYEYVYVEGERYGGGQHCGLRRKGFTNWMAHPSHGEVAVILAPGGWAEYDVPDLGAGPYHVFVRGLAWKEGCEIDVFWDGTLVGRPVYPAPGTVLRWSGDVGTVSGPGDHKLRLVRAPGTRQAPYIDAILLTTVPQYWPNNADQDFASFRTALPPFICGTDGRANPIAPLPGGTVPTAGELEVERVAMGRPALGDNPLTVTLRATEAMTVQLEAGLGEGTPALRDMRLLPGQITEATLAVPAEAIGDTVLALAVTHDGVTLLTGSYPVTVANPVTISLDEYAYPADRAQAVWLATFRPGSAMAQDTSLRVALYPAGRPEPSVSHELRPAGSQATAAFAIDALPLGRHRVEAEVLWRGKPVLEDTREFLRYTPVVPEVWEPVERTEAKGHAILLNGEPFLGRLLFHAGASADVKAHGFNLVQCHGGAPDPLPSIARHLNACREHGMWGMVALFNNAYFLPDREFMVEHIREAVLRFRDHPAVWGWDLVDEPDAREMDPKHVEEVASLVRELDPNHIVWVNLCHLNRTMDYLASQDLWSYDTYPIPAPGPTGYLQWLQVTDEKLRGARPIGTCLQTFQNQASGGVPMPTPDELRCSAYLHIIHGYTWFGAYSYYDPPPAGCLARNPVLWSYVRALNSELLTLAPVMLDETPFAPVASDQEDTLFQAAAKVHGGKRYLFGVSLNKETSRVAMSVGGRRARVLFETDRDVSIEQGSLCDDFPPYGVHVYVLAE